MTIPALTAIGHRLDAPHKVQKFRGPMHGGELCDAQPQLAYPDPTVHRTLDHALSPVVRIPEALPDEVGGGRRFLNQAGRSGTDRREWV